MAYDIPDLWRCTKDKDIQRYLNKMHRSAVIKLSRRNLCSIWSPLRKLARSLKWKSWAEWVHGGLSNSWKIKWKCIDGHHRIRRIELHDGWRRKVVAELKPWYTWQFVVHSARKTGLRETAKGSLRNGILYKWSWLVWGIIFIMLGRMKRTAYHLSQSTSSICGYSNK